MTRTSLADRASPYGAGFIDQTTGLRFEVHHPQERPDLWNQYLDGAQKRYRKHGFEPLLDRGALVDGSDVSMFWVGIDADGAVQAGLRLHGPVQNLDELHAIVEMAESPESDDLRKIIGRYLPYGVIEAKGAWGVRKGAGLHFLSKTFFRCTVHSMDWFGAELAIATLAERLSHWITFSGGRRIGTESVPFPSDKYRTVMVGWKRGRVEKSSSIDELRLVRTETHQLLPLPGTSAIDASGELFDPTESTAWRPIVFRCDRRADRESVARLSRSPLIKTIDRLNQQRAELARLVPTPPSEVLEEDPSFVYFPWRSTLIKMVGPRAYAFLRHDRNRNKITSLEQAQLRKLRIGVVGLSVGHSIAHILAMEGLCGELKLADFDQIETTNLNRIPATVLDLGVNKGVTAARRISEIDPYLPVSILPEGLASHNAEAFFKDLDIVIEECDALDVKLMVREVARTHRIPVLMETSDRGLFDVERFDLEPDRKPFHGLLGDITAQQIAGLSAKEKVPYILKILEAKEISSRGAASLAEVGLSLTTWPQLAGDVTLGAATVAAAVRRLGVKEPLPSGRVRIDIDQAVGTMSSPSVGDDELAQPPATSVELTSHPDAAEVVAYAASLAPSGGNAQPWCFEADDTELRVLLDRTRSTTMDLHFRGSYVAIGAALFNARVAAASQGVLGEVTLFPNGSEWGPVGVLSFAQRNDPGLSVFYPQVIQRVTNRNKGTPEKIPSEVISRLSTSVELEGARLHVVSERQCLEECAGILSESDRLRFLTPKLHKEIIGELSWPGRDRLDVGIDVRTLGLEPAELATLSIASRPEVMAHLADWDAGKALGANTLGAIRSSSALACVTVPGSSPADYVTGGSAVERMWLEAERCGLAVQPMSPVFIYASGRNDHMELVGERFVEQLMTISNRFYEIIGMERGEQIALILRLSQAPAQSIRSMRLPLDQVLTRLPHRPASSKNVVFLPSISAAG